MSPLLRDRVHRLPNFLVIGALKAGTTSLYHYLRSHPQIFMPGVKEIAFFAKDDVWSKGIDWYERQFAQAGSHFLAVGEASTLYATYPRNSGVPERIATHLPSARLIYVLRDPIQRIRSHYQHRVAVGAEDRPIDQALFANPIYIDCSRYAAQIEQYLRYFSREQLLLIASEDLRSARQATMMLVYEFLEVDSQYVPPNLDREYYKTDRRRVHSPKMGSLRNWVKSYFPQSKRAKEWFDLQGPLARRAVARKISTPGLGRLSLMENSVTIPEHISCRLKETLREDVRTLRQYLNEAPAWTEDY